MVAGRAGVAGAVAVVVGGDWVVGVAAVLPSGAAGLQ